MYRGYDIADLAEHATYEDVAYLLLEGELPSSEASAAFHDELSARELPAPAAAVVDGGSRESAPMEMLRTAASSLSFTDPAEAAIDRENERRKGAQLIALLPTVVARPHPLRQGVAAGRARAGVARGPTRSRQTPHSRIRRTSSRCGAASRRRSRRCARSTSR